MSKASALYQRRRKNSFIPANDLHNNHGFSFFFSHYIESSFFHVIQRLNLLCTFKNFEDPLEKTAGIYCEILIYRNRGVGKADHNLKVAFILLWKDTVPQLEENTSTFCSSLGILPTYVCSPVLSALQSM